MILAYYDARLLNALSSSSPSLAEVPARGHLRSLLYVVYPLYLYSIRDGGRQEVRCM